LLSDIELPDGNGLDLMREVHVLGGVAGIAMSGFGAEDDLRMSREAGFSDHLTKPIDLSRLDSAIRRVATPRDRPGGEPDEAGPPSSSRTEEGGSGAFEVVRAH
jgi:DNA-binding response OmpR family regulator